ncbi:umecyanin-like [Henckelia pumila]|uniref:umecyanin-like n=1 Tax=Henckelia pumila TaxID=405737 RepID=UPI003C6E3DC6
MARVSTFLVVFSVVFAVVLHCSAAQTVHTVGGDICWEIPPNSSLSYANWTSGKTFSVGDILVFNFETNQHDLARVTKASYDACNDDNVIGSVITTGPANVTLATPGDHYYICTFGSHCVAGQKLAITVRASSSSTPGGGPAAAPPPPPDSASSSLVSGFLLVLLLPIGAALIL